MFFALVWFGFGAGASEPEPHTCQARAIPLSHTPDHSFLCYLIPVRVVFLWNMEVFICGPF
jgi:hypothetical protein